MIVIIKTNDKIKTQVQKKEFYFNKVFESNDLRNFSKKLFVNFRIMFEINGI